VPGRSSSYSNPSVVPFHTSILGVLLRPIESAQYTSLYFGKRLEDEGLVPSMGRVGSAYDNALAESFVATLKTELLYRSSWPTRQVVKKRR
jgi:putative transposase